MYINTVLSFLGAWEKLQRERKEIFSDLQSVISRIEPEVFLRQIEKESLLSHVIGRKVKDFLKEELAMLNWQIDFRIPYGERKRRFRSIDFLKDGIGAEFGSYSRYDFVQSNLFVKYPMFNQLGYVKLMVVMIPLDLFSYQDAYYREPFATITFKIIHDQLRELYPFPLKYQFVILGLSSTPSTVEVKELTSHLDNFLVETTGYSLFDMKLSREKERYDFKEKLPSENRNIFHLVCALANQSRGGVILFGVNDNGDITGIQRSELDEFKNTIARTVSHNCRPCPAFTFLDFDDPSDSNKCVLVVHVQELEQKPCMADEKVYIRVGSESRAAKSEEIRRLILR